MSMSTKIIGINLYLFIMASQGYYIFPKKRHDINNQQMLMLEDKQFTYSFLPNVGTTIVKTNMHY